VASAQKVGFKSVTKIILEDDLMPMHEREVRNKEDMKRYLMEGGLPEPTDTMLRILYGVVEYEYARPYHIKTAYAAGVLVGRAKTDVTRSPVQEPSVSKRD